MKNDNTSDPILANFKELRSLLENCLRACTVYEHEIPHLRELTTANKEAIQSCLINFINPIISEMEGYQKSESENTAPGAGGGSQVNIFDVPDGYFEVSMDSSSGFPFDRITEHDLGDGCIILSIPQEYLAIINANRNELQDIVEDFLAKVKDETDVRYFDIALRSAEVEVANLLKIDYKEATSIFKFFVWQYFNKG